MENSNDISANNAENDAGATPPRKRARLDDSEAGVVKESTTSTSIKEGNITLADPALLEHAKKRLSKWAARLFDPDRPRGLVEAPQTIPLNDEFLAAFGKREKEYDEKMGKVMDFDSRITSDDDNDDDDDEETRKQKQAARELKEKEKEAKKKGKSLTKVKITNLAYRTSSEIVAAACEHYGPLAEVNLILEDGKEPTPSMQNSGRAYITFENAEDAEACIQGLESLDGRAVRVTMANAKPQGASNNPSSSASGPPRPASILNRSLEKDISTICYRCGGVGHIEANCSNAAKPKPCPLCGSTEHPIYQCPCKQICFNCGTPGHVSRACPYQRGLPRRVCCSICLYPGHHRTECRANRNYIYQQGAIDIMNGSDSLKWFHGLRGITCCNCGGSGHFSWECQRPKIHHLVQDNELATREIERAMAESMANQLEEQRSRNNRGRDMERGGGGKKNRFREVQSLPPKRTGSGGRSSSDVSNKNNNGRGYNTSGGGNRKRSRGY